MMSTAVIVITFPSWSGLPLLTLSALAGVQDHRWPRPRIRNRCAIDWTRPSLAGMTCHVRSNSVSFDLS